MAAAIGIDVPELPFEQQFHLQGLEPTLAYEGKRWIRLASRHPEHIDYVDFYRNGDWVDRAYDEPFLMFSATTWLQNPWHVRSDDRLWKAVVHLADGRVVEKVVEFPVRRQ